MLLFTKNIPHCHKTVEFLGFLLAGSLLPGPESLVNIPKLPVVATILETLVHTTLLPMTM